MKCLSLVFPIKIIYKKISFLQKSLIPSAVKIFEFKFLIKTDGHTIVTLEPELSKDFVHDVGGHSITMLT